MTILSDFKRCILLTTALMIFAAPTHAAILAFDKGIGWASFRDLSSSEFSKKFHQYKKAGYIMIDVDAYSASGGTRYAMVWRKNTDNRGWAEYRGMTSEKYNERWKAFRKKGYRPIDIESYRVGNKQRYAGIWVQNKEGYGWSSRRNLTAQQYADYFQAQKNKGYRIIDMEAYPTGNGIRYSAIWVQNKEKIQWAQLRDMDRSRYQKEVNERSKKGFIIVDYESYKIGNKRYYAAIWEKRSGYATQVRTNRSALQFANLWREYRDKGYRLIDFERDGAKYGGVWVENASRYRYNKKAQINSLVSQYKSDNTLPGISVAVVKDGSTIYRRGFGHADKGAGKVAHGGTVYLAASISKAIGGTIAVKLQDENRLRNGSQVSLNLNNTTRSYLTHVRQSNGSRVTLPRRHTHTVAQLASHLGCIEHYDGPEPSTKHYATAIDALPQIWNAAFVSPCAVGTNRNYSTHAFTYVGAVLEKVTGKTAAQLIRSEIAAPYNLNTMRALYSSSNIPSDYDRAKPYRSNNTPTSFSNNSWKIFGGGIEVSAVDLARFGWKVLDGTIVDADARDNVLWTRVNSSQSNGIAWTVRSRGGRRVAEHGGSWTGARSQLRVYRDDGLVIAVMSNRSNHTVGSLSSLTEDIANVVLN